LWAPKALRLTAASATKAFKEQRLPLALATKELDGLGVLSPKEAGAHLACQNFLEASAALEGQELAALLPDFLAPSKNSKSFLRVQIPKIDSHTFEFHLAWNPRLLRLNPHAARRRDLLAELLARQIDFQHSK
jgi:hypothetical protein